MATWNAKLDNSEKLKFTNKQQIIMRLKAILYISETNISLRKELTKLRISNHDLLIERGRYCLPKVPREERLCPVCSKQTIEDEIHFIFDCPFYSKERENLRQSLLDSQNIDLNSMNRVQQINALFISSSQETHTALSQHIFSCVKKRKEHLHKH